MANKRILMLVNDEDSADTFGRKTTINGYDIETYRRGEVFAKLREDPELMASVDLIMCPLYKMHYALLFKAAWQKPILAIAVLSSDSDRNQVKKDLDEIIEAKFAEYHCIIDMGNRSVYEYPNFIQTARQEIKKTLDMIFKGDGGE